MCLTFYCSTSQKHFSHPYLLYLPPLPPASSPYISLLPLLLPSSNSTFNCILLPSVRPPILIPFRRRARQSWWLCRLRATSSWSRHCWPPLILTSTKPTRCVRAYSYPSQSKSCDKPIYLTCSLSLTTAIMMYHLPTHNMCPNTIRKISKVCFLFLSNDRMFYPLRIKTLFFVLPTYWPYLGSPTHLTNLRLDSIC